MKILQKIKNVKEGLVAAAALSFLLCIYAPVELFLGSQDDFWFDLGTLIGTALCMFVAVYALLVLVISLLRWWGKLPYNIGIGLYAAGFLACYIQGTFFAGDLPPLDGTNIDWSAGVVQRIQSIATVLVVVAILTFILLKFKEKIFKKTVLYASAALGLILLLTISTLCLTTPVVEKEADLVCTGYGDFTYSTDTNFIVLIIDATDNEAFLKSIEKRPELKEIFADFTYYNDAASMYPYTMCAIPSMLTGVWYENECTYREYMDRAFEESPLINQLRQEDYRMGFYYKDEIKLSEKWNGIFENLLYAKPKFSGVLPAAVTVTKMSAIRYAPWDLKRFGYNISEHLDDSKRSDTEPVKKNNQLFYNTLKSGAITTVDEKCARIIHLEGSHVPYRYDINVEKKDNATYLDNVDCTLTICAEFIKQLKENGVYDNSVIAILSDHGFDDLEKGYSRDRANPAFMVKGIGETGDELKINSKPISYQNTAEAFTALINQEVTRDTLFDKYSYPDGRRFIDYAWVKNTYMKECIIEGTAADWENIIPTGRVYEREE